MARAWQWAGVVALGVLVGAGSALYGVASGRGEIRVGPWATGTVYGSRDADMYTRARVALFGLLALGRDQTVYYTANSDDAGEPLSGDCTYLVTGTDLAARWWSVTAYGPDSYLIPNEARIYSFSKTTVTRDADDRYAVRVSAAPQPGNWLPVKAGEHFDMTARFYNPDPSVHDDPAAVALPSISKEGCR